MIPALIGIRFAQLARRNAQPIDPDIIILQDWVSQVGLQPTVGTVPSASFDPTGPLDVRGTGWNGTPYVNSRTIGRVNKNNLSANPGIGYNFEGGLVLGDGLSDFTIEAWIRRTNTSNDPNSREDERLGLVNLSSPAENFLFGSFESAICTLNNGRKNPTWPSGSMPLNEWHHYALVMHNGSYFGFRDGIKSQGSTLVPHAIPSFVIRPQLYRPTGIGDYENPRYDYAQICLTKRAKWLENFTPPTRPYCLGME